LEVVMSLKEAFVRDVIENPEDNAPRLIYADWLEENGDPARAELIRLQILEWKMTGDKWGPSPYSRRIMELFRPNRDRWVREELPGWLHKEHYIGFRRGFAEGVGTTALRLVQKAEELWRAAPVQKLILRGAGGRVKALAACPFLARVTELMLMNSVGDEDMIALASSPHLGKLTELDLSNSQVGDAGARALATCPGLAGLTMLDLHISRVGDEGALALAASPYLNHLERLDLICNPISPAARATLKDRFGERLGI
jgi:uncharacterized protein (TIGR02996 family)